MSRLWRTMASVLVALMLAVSATAFLPGCAEDDPAEEAGEAVEEAGEAIGDAAEDIAD